MDFEKPKIFALIAPDVVADVATLQLWCLGSTFGMLHYMLMLRHCFFPVHTMS